jgi:hypothetical protein
MREGRAQAGTVHVNGADLVGSDAATARAWSGNDDIAAEWHGRDTAM